MSLFSHVCFSLIFLNSAFIPAQSPLPTAAYTVIENEAKTPILTPSVAERKTLKIRLANQMEAILVSDPRADQSSAAMTVKVGSWEDPKEHPGLAHFNEHMLFMGTAKYPKESDYQRFIAEHGGQTNAFTANDFTSYMFSVNNDAFGEALDRFANFFIKPLFNPSGVSRELNAIDQEYAKNVENDDIRQLYVMKELTNPDHPDHEFGMGNSSTLSKVEQDVLIKWYQEHYSANLMTLIVYSPLPLDTLKNMIVEDFSAIPNKNKKLFAIDNIPVTTEANKAKMVYIEPVKDLHNLILAWYLPPKFADMLDTQPEALVCYVLGHEGEGSLLAELKREHLAEELRCGGVKTGAQSMLFYLDIDLTLEGVKHVNTVIERAFQAIDNFKKAGVPNYLFDDMQKIAKIKYAYTPREDSFDMVMKDATHLAYEPTATYPEHTLIPQKFDPAIVKEFLNFLTPANAGFYFLVPSRLSGIHPDREEKWLNVKYSVHTIPARQMDDWANAPTLSQLTLPAKNPLIPENLSLVNSITQSQAVDIPIPVAKALVDNEYGKIYYAPDQFFGVPKVYWSIEIKTPNIRAENSAESVIADLFIKNLLDSVKKFSYDATMAGFNFVIKQTENGIAIIIDGYNDNASALLEAILKALKTGPIDEATFNLYKDTLQREYLNSAKDTPITQATDQFKSVIYRFYSTNQQKAHAIQEVTFNLYNEAVSKLFDQTFVEGILYGNLTEEQARQVSQKVLDTVKAQPYPKDKQLKKEVITLPNSGPYYIENRIPVQGNAVVLGIETADFSFKTRAAQQILMQAISSPFFAELRTKQQTGYIVYSSNEEIDRKLFNLFLIQSNTYESHDLLARIEIFLENFVQEIGKSQLTEEDFNVIKKTLIDNIKHSINNTTTMGDLLKTLAFKYDGDFDWMNKRVQGFEELSYSEFLNLSQVLLSKENRKRLAILMNGQRASENDWNYRRIDTVSQLRKAGTWGTTPTVTPATTAATPAEKHKE